MSKVFLNNILISVTYMISCWNILSSNTKSINKTAPFDANDTTLKIYRRVPPLEPPRFQGINHKLKIDTYYEPYWENGDWVYHRKGSTKYATGFILNTGSTLHRECNQICINLYQDYGPVCGMRLIPDNEYKYEHKTFLNMCYLELANCVHNKKRHDWYPANRGECHSHMTTYPIYGEDIKKRLTAWLKNYTD